MILYCNKTGYKQVTVEKNKTAPTRVGAVLINQFRDQKRGLIGVIPAFAGRAGVIA